MCHVFLEVWCNPIKWIAKGIDLRSRYQVLEICSLDWIKFLCTENSLCTYLVAICVEKEEYMLCIQRVYLIF